MLAEVVLDLLSMPVSLLGQVQREHVLLDGVEQSLYEALSG